MPILLASSGSLRRSEICALTPDDITDIGITVNKAAVYDKDNNVVIKPPKTNAGNRFVPLPPHILKEVREWKYFGCSPATLYGQFRRLVEKCDVPHITHYFNLIMPINTDFYFRCVGFRVGFGLSTQTSESVAACDTVIIQTVSPLI